MDEIKYLNLIQILDNICNEAPEAFKKYHPNKNNEQEVSKSRSLAYIHLYLKVKYGLSEFLEREKYITEGSQDGGLDAYYIDENKFHIYLIQSKMRESAKGFREKSLTSDELIKTEFDRIIKGKRNDSRGNDFNSKIKKFQDRIKKLSNIGKFDYKVIFLGNIKYTKSQIEKNIGKLPYQLFNADNCYDELILPLVSGVNFDPDEIMIYININDDNESYLEKFVSTSNGESKTMVVLVPALEIAKIMNKYKNAILQFNPRNYLSFEKNNVNSQIRKSIVKNPSNDFAVLNNGITMISDKEVTFNHTGKEGEGQIVITNPQIINGGQTAYTLSEVYRTMGSEVFKDKEVLLRIISVFNDESSNLNDFIQQISVSTNQQSKVSDADRKSNDPIQVELQTKIYNDFGYYYERKLGEFHTGLKDGYLQREYIIDRVRFIRSYCAFLGNPSDARGNSSDLFFKEKNFKRILGRTHEYKKMFFAYNLFLLLIKISRNPSKYTINNKVGLGLKFGKHAIISSFKDIGFKNTIDVEFIKDSEELLIERLSKWKKFEDRIKKKQKNRIYYEGKAFNFGNYYKGKTINEDIRVYFKIKK